MPRFIACSILCRCSWQYNAALLLHRHSTAKPNSKSSRTFTIDMVSLKFLQHHKHYYSKKYQHLRNCKRQRFCRESLQIRALWKLGGILLRCTKASQPLPPWYEKNYIWYISKTKICNSTTILTQNSSFLKHPHQQYFATCQRCQKVSLE